MDIIFENRKYEGNDYKDILKKYDYPWSEINCVALIMKRSPELLFLIYHLFENKIAFIPIDPNYPVNRIEYILGDSAPDVALSDIIKNYNYNKTTKNHLTEAAYILYTSGSTGNPKGVEVTREGLLNFSESISEIIDFSPGKRIACLTTISFDIFFLESIIAMQKGLTVVLANEDEQYNPKLMAKFIQNNAIEMIQMTPSKMQLLLNHDKELSCLKNVREIMIGGEPFPFSLLRTLQEKTTAKIYNMYGPTETTIWSTISDLTRKDRIDIGFPIKNTEIYIVDESASILSDGQVGEICIAGKGLAKGYVGKEELTKEKFIYLPQKPDIKVYRTGDLGRYLPDGNLDYLGRVDNQVKIHGHRIELEEIEKNINQFEGIKQSIVIVMEIGETDKILAAFYTSDSDIHSKDIINYLSAQLPSYMIPAIYKRLEGFIQTDNGKIDRKKVLECIEIKPDPASRDLTLNNIALNEIQKKIMSIIETNLETKITHEISLDTSLLSIGIDSITFIKMVVALEGEFHFEFDDEMLLITKFPIVKSMVEYVESKVQ